MARVASQIPSRSLDCRTALARRISSEPTPVDSKVQARTLAGGVPADSCAYERLDNQLRYGAGPSFGSLPAGVDWSQIFSAQPEAVAASRFESTDSSKSAESLQKQHQDYLSALMEEVRTSSPEAVFNRLNGKAEKSPFEYYALAVLSDTLPDRSTEKFVSHLLAGLAASPKDNGLRGMLYALFRQALTPAEIPTILLKTARVIRNDSFYSLTEPLWDILVRRYPFAKVRELLAQCESSASRFRIEAKLAFYLHLLRISMFRADREWIEQTDCVPGRQPFQSEFDE